ncbi:hypothetical protein [Rosenbergiella nectarea]|nr:hypothetical protein [Rosenbergiella nectarea]MBT0729350.1 hypothetical protein [Rosenbergiella nectarea subsp. apis]
MAKWTYGHSDVNWQPASLLPLDNQRYSLLWVNYLDKGQLMLNVVI